MVGPASNALVATSCYIDGNRFTVDQQDQSPKLVRRAGYDPAASGVEDPRSTE